MRRGALQPLLPRDARAKACISRRRRTKRDSCRQRTAPRKSTHDRRGTRISRAAVSDRDVKEAGDGPRCPCSREPCSPAAQRRPCDELARPRRSRGRESFSATRRIMRFGSFARSPARKAFNCVRRVLRVLSGEPRKLRRDAGAVRAVARRARRDAFLHDAAAIDLLPELHELGIARARGLRLLAAEIQREIRHVVAARGSRRCPS